MSSPLKKKMDSLLSEDRSSFHTPGHKGKGVFFLKYDLTELEGLESLYENTGAIAELEREYSKVYATETVLSAGGSTLCIQTMLAMTLNSGDSIIAGRGAHIAFVNALGLLGVNPCWVYPSINKTTGLAKPVTAEEISQAIDAFPQGKAVYVTSPDYYGQVADIKGIAEICRCKGKPLLVDCAHGAHLKFLEKSLYPTDLGADICCGSLHKTLPVMTGGAILSMSSKFSVNTAKRYMSIFGSTSPSYGILYSADLCLELLKTGINEKTREIAKKCEQIRALASETNLFSEMESVDPCRLVLNFAGIGYTKEGFKNMLAEGKIEPEYVDDRFCVLIPTVNTSEKDWLRVADFVKGLEIKPPVTVATAELNKLECACTIREAILAKSGQTIPVEEGVGRVTAGVAAPCPPGIPLTMPGERLDRAMVETLKKRGISLIDVL